MAFTIDEQKKVDTARGASIVEYLERRGYNLVPGQSNTANTFFRSPFTEDKTASFRVKNATNTFSDFSSGYSGDIIALIERLEGLQFWEAVDKALEILGTSAPVVINTELLPETKIRRVIDLEHPQLLQYLLEKRKINLTIAKQYCKQVEWTVNKKDGTTPKFYFAIGFEVGKGGAYTCRNEFWKGYVGPGEQNSPTYIKGTDENSTKLNVYEGFIDFLSALTRLNKLVPTHPTLILNSIVWKALIPDGLEYDAYVDNDNGGQQVIDYLKTIGKCNDMRVYYRSFPDFNEYHINTPTKQHI